MLLPVQERSLLLLLLLVLLVLVNLFFFLFVLNFVLLFFFYSFSSFKVFFFSPTLPPFFLKLPLFVVDNGFPPPLSPSPYRLVGLLVKASDPRAVDPRFGSCLRRGDLALLWLLCQAPGVTESALGPVSPVSVYCD